MSSELRDALDFPIRTFVLENADDLTRGLLIVGSTGSGKTNDALWIVAELTDLGVPAFVFDVKREYRRLLGYVEARDRLAILRADRFPFNPLTPPSGVDHAEWIQVFAETFAYEFGLSEPSKAMLYWAAERLREDEGPFTLKALHDQVEAFSPRSEGEANSRASVLNRLYLLNRGTLGASLNVEEAVGVEDFLDRTVVLELSPTMDVSLQSFLMGAVIAHIYAHFGHLPRHAAEPAERDRLRYAIVVEEAHRVLSEQRPDWMAGRRSFIERAVAEGREFGLGFVLVDQIPNQLSTYAVANCNAVIAHRLVSSPDHREMVDELRLTRPPSGPKQQHLLSLMPDGYAFAKILHQETLPRWISALPAESRSPWKIAFTYRKTELVRTPLFKRRARTMPSDREVAAHMEKFPLKGAAKPKPVEVKGRALADMFMTVRHVFGNLIAFQIAWSLYEGPKSYEVLAKLTGSSRAAVSKHAGRVVEAGIVKRSRTGKGFECALTRKGRLLLETLYSATREK